MEIGIIEEDNSRIRFKVEGEDHTFCNLLKNELLQDKNVDVATYAIKHPLIGVPRFTVEVKKGKARDVVMDAAKRVKKNLDSAKKEAKSIK